MTNSIRPENIEKEITTYGFISNYEQTEPVLQTGVFTCKACLKQYEVEQKEHEIHEPSVCPECGGKKFTLNIADSKFTNMQKATLDYTDENIDKSMEIHLYGDNVINPDGILGQPVTARGILKVKFGKVNKYYLERASVTLVHL